MPNLASWNHSGAALCVSTEDQLAVYGVCPNAGSAASTRIRRSPGLVKRGSVMALIPSVEVRNRPAERDLDRVSQTIGLLRGQINFQTGGILGPRAAASSDERHVGDRRRIEGGRI